MFKKLLNRQFSTNVTKAAVCESLNKPLIYRDWDLGSLPSDQMKIEVVAAGINFGDLLQCQGKYQEKLDPPFVCGMEFAGRIVEIGSQVKPGRFSLGDRVICIGQRGFAKHAIVPPSSVILLPRNLPESLDLSEAAALVVSYGTAYLALTSQGRVKPGESVFITAAAGGVGLASVELAREYGARVIAAAGSDDKVQLAISKGGPDATGFNYTGCDAKTFRSKLKDVAGSKGVDVFLDAVGGEFLEAGIRSLNWDGRAVIVGFAGGEIPKIPANILLVKNVSLCGLYWGAHAKGNPKLMAQSTSEVIRLWAEGKIKPHISHRFPLEKVNDAFATIQARQSSGKVVLCP